MRPFILGSLLALVSVSMADEAAENQATALGQALPKQFWYCLGKRLGVLPK